jgi:hypothetical protein
MTRPELPDYNPPSRNFMVNPEKWQDKVVKGKKYQIKTRFDDGVIEFMGLGAIDSYRQDQCGRDWVC